MRTTSKSGQWLDEAHQAALAGGDRELTLDEREQSVETVEGQLEAEFSRLESELTATSAGPALLRKVFGERSDTDARLSFAVRDRGLRQVEQEVRAELGAREEVLRSIGSQYLSEEAPCQSGGAAGTAETLPAWESRVRGAEQRLAEELDRREKQVRAIAGSDRLIEEAIELLEENGVAISGDGSFAEQAQIIEMAKGVLENDLVGIEREEAAILEDPGGAERLRNARVEVLGSVDREAKTVVERQAIIDTVLMGIREEALRSFPLGKQYLSEAEQARAGRKEGPPSLTERESMVNAVEQRGRQGARSPREAAQGERTRRRPARGRVRPSALRPRPNPRATGANHRPGGELARRKIIECVSRVAAQFDVPGGDEVLFAALDKRKPAWRQKDTLPAEVIDEALDDVEEEPGRRKEAPLQGWSSRRSGSSRAPPARPGLKRATAAVGPQRLTGMPGASRRRSRIAPVSAPLPPRNRSRRRPATSCSGSSTGCGLKLRGC